MTTTFIYRYDLGVEYKSNGIKIRKVLEKTHAYVKIEEDLFLIVTIRKNGGDNDCKKVARQFASDKLDRILNLYNETNCKLVPKGKNSYRLVNSEELSELKRQTYFKNDMLNEMIAIQSKFYRGASWEEVAKYKAAQKAIKRAKKS